MDLNDFKESFPDKSGRMEKEGSIGIKTRTVIYFLAFSGFAINFVITNSVPVAIVNMIDTNFISVKNQSEERVIISSECIAEGNFTSQPEFSSLSNETIVNEIIDLVEVPVDSSKHVSLERRLLNLFNIGYDQDGFKWDEHQQAQILGSFFWINWIAQIPGGILAAKYGTKFLFGFSHLIVSIIGMLIPFFCYLDYRWMVAFRAVQGMILGLTFPAMHNLIGKWVPPNERSVFVTVYFGDVGAAVAFPLFGYLIRVSSWEWTFHACGICGIIWYVLWQYFVYDTPEQHPRIHPREREFILQSLGSSVDQDNSKKPAVPWIAIVTSKALWINTFGQFGCIFGVMTLITQMPSYFKHIHGWGSEATGLLSGLPHLPLVVLTIAFSVFADNLLSSERMTRNNVRRLSAFVGMVLNGFFILGLAHSRCNVALAVFFLTLSICSNATSSASFMSSIVDIAPNYAGITMGIVSTVGTMSGFISPIVVGFITFENQTVEAWKRIFQICAAMLIVSGGVYIAFVDTSVQDWNNVSEVSEEIKPLNTIEAKEYFINGSNKELKEEKN